MGTAAGANHERGFTLVELMVVLVTIGVLTKIAIPMFFGESRKGKARTETAAVFAELAIKEQQYKMDYNTYLAAAACPAVPAAAGQSATACVAGGEPWNSLRVQLPAAKLYCSYQIVTGSGTGTNDPSGFRFTSPPGSWFYVIATCDMDDSSTINSTYFTSSVDSTIQKLNDGK